MMIYPQADFARSTPEAQGISSGAIERVLEDIRTRAADIHSMLIMRRGYLVFEHYFAPYGADTPHAMYSCSKTFTSMLIGIAQDKGLLSIKDKVISFFPEKFTSAPDGYLAEMTVEDLLMMGSGHAKDTFPAMMAAMNDPQADFVDIFLRQSVDFKPGTHFVYNTGATYMLSAILTKVTGRTALSLAEEWLFEPMDIRGATWETCPKGISLGGTGLRITPRDMLKMGMLLLAHGRWKDKQLVSREYVMNAQTKHIENRSGDPNQDPNWAAGYCYQIWRCAFDAFRADGMGGQFITVIPKHEMIVVFTSALGGSIPIGYPLRLVEDILLKGVYPLHQVVSEDASASLKQLAESLAHPAAQALPAAASAFPFGRRIVLNDRACGVEDLTIDRDGASVTLTDGTKIHADFDWGAPKINPTPQSAGMSRAKSAVVSGEARWRDDNSVTVFIRYLGEPLSLTFTVKPQDGGVSVWMNNTLGGAYELTGQFA